jgi:hypothetical protein
MITIDRFPAFNGQPPGIVVRFNYIEPTHEVVEALTRAGIDSTSAFRSVTLREQIDPWPAGGLTEDVAAFRLDMIEDSLMECLGEMVWRNQSEKLVTQPVPCDVS